MTENNSKYVYKVHATGPTMHSGFHRSLCEQMMVDGPYHSSKTLTTKDKSEVTCIPCLARLKRDESRDV